MKTKDIKEILNKKIDCYAVEKGAVGSETDENNKIFSKHVIFKRIKIMFVYSLKEKIDCPASTLHCMVYPIKNSESAFNLCEIVTAIHRQDLTCCVFPYIENEERLDVCFAQLTSILDEYIPLLEEAMETTEFIEYLENSRRQDIIRNYRVNEDNIDDTPAGQEFIEWLIHDYERNLVWRLTNEPAYQMFLQGNYEKAKKKYLKKIEKNRIFSYEKILYDFLGTMNSGEYYEAISARCYSYKQAKKTDTPLQMIGVLLFFYITWSGLFFLISKIPMLTVGRSAVFVCGLEWYFPLIFAGLPTLLFSLLYKGEIYQLCGKKQKADFDLLMVTEHQRKWLKIIVWMIGIFVFAVNCWLSMPTAVMYQDRMYANEMEDFFQLEYVEYRYENVYKVYFTKGRYNDWDEYIKRSSYVMVMKDGSILDFDTVTDFIGGNAQVEKYVLPYLGEKGKSVTIVKSEKEIRDGKY